MIMLDLFCGAGGAAMGYHRAGFQVVGVDINPQPRYPFPFIQADAITFPLDGYDLYHASPPCQDHSAARHINGKDHGTGWMLAATRERLAATGKPYVIENVPGAPMINPLKLCGSEFGLTALDVDGIPLRLERHRLFESNLFLYGAGGCQHGHFRVAGVYGNTDGLKWRAKLEIRRAGGGHQYRPSLPVQRNLMGINWMNRRELGQAIPPAYTKFIGEQIREQMAVAA
jgi:DNA (cytosine-5)-methyltransferase 1